MATSKRTTHDKIQQLRSTIASATEKLQRIEEKRKLEIGELARRCGLDVLDNKTLEAKFKQIAKELDRDAVSA